MNRPTLLLKKSRVHRFPNMNSCAQYLQTRYFKSMSIKGIKTHLYDCNKPLSSGRQTISGYHVMILDPVPVKETWKSIPEYPGYQASTHGRIRSLPRITYRGATVVHLSGTLMKQSVTPKSYLQVHLHERGHDTTTNVNRLVADAFLPNPHHYTKTNHKDENRMNNFVTNLEWCTQDYLVHYGHRTERTYRPIELVKGSHSHYFPSLWFAAEWLKKHELGKCTVAELHNWLSSCASPNNVYNHIHGYRVYRC